MWKLSSTWNTPPPVGRNHPRDPRDLGHCAAAGPSPTLTSWKPRSGQRSACWPRRPWERSSTLARGWMPSRRGATQRPRCAAGRTPRPPCGLNDRHEEADDRRGVLGHSRRTPARRWRRCVQRSARPHPRRSRRSRTGCRASTSTAIRSRTRRPSRRTAATSPRAARPRRPSPRTSNATTSRRGRSASRSASRCRPRSSRSS